MERTFLLTASVPQHISLAVDKLRNTLFAKTGTVSALVFESVVPLAFLNQSVSKTLFPNIVLQKKPFEITRFFEQHDAYYLEMVPHTLFKQIHEIIRGYTAPPLFDPVSGFFLAAAEPSIDKRAALSLFDTYQVSDLPPWEKLSLKLLRVEYTDKNLWWNEIDWSVIWELKLRRGLPFQAAE